MAPARRRSPAAPPGAPAARGRRAPRSRGNVPLDRLARRLIVAEAQPSHTAQHRDQQHDGDELQQSAADPTRRSLGEDGSVSISGHAAAPLALPLRTPPSDAGRFARPFAGAAPRFECAPPTEAPPGRTRPTEAPPAAPGPEARVVAACARAMCYGRAMAILWRRRTPGNRRRAERSRRGPAAAGATPPGTVRFRPTTARPPGLADRSKPAEPAPRKETHD